MKQLIQGHRAPEWQIQNLLNPGLIGCRSRRLNHWDFMFPSTVAKLSGVFRDYNLQTLPYLQTVFGETEARRYKKAVLY